MNFEEEIDLSTRKSLKIIHHYCKEKEAFIAVAESVSAGLLQWVLASEEFAGDYFAGGITAYNCDEKAKHFGVSESKCHPCMGVCREISKQMAEQICQKFQCKLGLSLTGFASTVPEEGISERFAYGSLAIDGQLHFTKKFAGSGGTPGEVQLHYVSQLLDSCAFYLAHCLK